MKRRGAIEACLWLCLLSAHLAGCSGSRQADPPAGGQVDSMAAGPAEPSSGRENGAEAGGWTAAPPADERARVPGSPVHDEAALHDQYVAMQQEAMRDVRAWKGPLDGPDPRLTWADRLQEFARAHAGSKAAADALLGALVLRAGRGDVDGFFPALDQALASIPDQPGLADIFPQIVSLRWAEAGGPGIIASSDSGRRREALRRALPRIQADFQGVLQAVSSPATVAAAHYALGMACYQLEVDPACALEHFGAVAQRHPEFAQAESARTYVRELTTLAVGMPAPDFEVTLLDGRTTRLSDQRGRIVLVDFWATWCRPCLEELPELKDAYARYRAQGFTVLGISLDTEVPAVRQFVSLHRIRWPVAASGLGMSDPVARAWSLQGIPMSYLVDRDGIIRARAVAGAGLDSAVAALTSPGAQR